MMIAEELSNLAANSRDKDFLSKFAYTQTFAFMIQRYITEKNEGQITETEGLDTERDSPLKLGKIDSVISVKADEPKQSMSMLRSTMAESPSKQNPEDQTKPARVSSQIVVQNIDTVNTAGNDESPMPRSSLFSQLEKRTDSNDLIKVEPVVEKIDSSSARSSVKSNPSQSSEKSNALKQETEEAKKRSKASKTLNRMKTPDNPYTGTHPNNPYIKEEDLSQQ